MSIGVVLARVLAAFTVTAAPGAAALSGPSPTITTGDAAASAPGQVESTGGNVVVGDTGGAVTGPPPATPSAAPVLHTPPLPAPRVAARPVARNADAAVAGARAKADAARALGLAKAEEAKRTAAEASTRAQTRGDEARQQGASAYSADD